MSIPQHLTPLPLKPFKLDKMPYYIYRYFETCILYDRPYGVAGFQFVAGAFFLARYYVVAAAQVIEAAF